MDCIILGVNLPAADDAVAVEWMQLAEKPTPPSLVCSNKGGAGGVISGFKATSFLAIADKRDGSCRLAT